MGASRYTLAEAQALLPEARTRVAEVAMLVRDLQVLLADLRAGRTPMRTVDRAAELEERIDVLFGWFADRDVGIKGLDPTLLDFPARAVRDGEPIDVLLCWREDEKSVAYYHAPEDGYRFREPVGLLDRV